MRSSLRHRLIVLSFWKKEDAGSGTGSVVDDDKDWESLTFAIGINSSDTGSLDAMSR